MRWLQKLFVVGRMAVMEIVYLGHSCFRIKGKSAVVITDPFSTEMVGLKYSKQQADIVTVSHQHQDHNSLELIKPKSDSLLVFDSPGEYESNGVDIRAWRTYHDDQQGVARGNNVIFQINIEGISILHLGDLGHQLSDEIVDSLGNVDLLMIPVGGYYTIDANVAVKVVKQVDPKVIIPMHYYIPGMNSEVFGDLGGVDDFLKEINVNVNYAEKLNLSKNDLSDSMSVMVLSA